MKTFIALIILILRIASPGLSKTIPKENQVILSNTSCWSEIKWTPTEEQTAKALTAIEKLLNDPEALKKFDERKIREADKVRGHFAEYHVQFCGVIEDDREYILCNFFKPYRPSEFQNWRNQLVFVLDGGFWYWSILYDPKTGELIKLDINGYA